jgi:hypothetical protein
MLRVESFCRLRILAVAAGCLLLNSGIVLAGDPARDGAKFTAGAADSCSSQLPGDLNSSLNVDIADVAFLIKFLCQGGSPPATPANADVDGDCYVDSADILYLVHYIAGQGPAPVSCTCVQPFIGGCTGQRLDVTKSFADDCLVACPAGDAGFTVHLRNTLGGPLVGSEDVWLDFSGCGSTTPCPSESEWPLVRPTAPSDSAGRVRFFVHAGTCNDGCQVAVRSSRGLIAQVPFKSTDINGDLLVTLTDYMGSLCNDYNCSGTLDGTDLSFATAHFGHSCTSEACDLVGRSLVLVPDTALQVGEPVEVRIDLQNQTTGTCRFDSVVFYESGFDVGANPQRFTARTIGIDLPSGGATSVSVPYVIPGAGAGCVGARTYTSCCDTSSWVEYCVNVIRLECPAPDSFEFSYWVYPAAPVYYKALTSAMPIGFRSGLNPGDGWFSAPTTVHAWVAIDQFAVFGADASIVMLLCTDNTCSNILTRREFRVFYQQQRGDVNRDCAITSSDIIHLVNYVFKSGPPPQPDVEAGNVNCVGAITSSDIIFLVNYVFKGGDPPLGVCP